MGSYTLAGESIVFTPGATTLMACPPALDTLEKRLIEALARTKRWQIKGNTLEFMDETGSQIALFEAVYLSICCVIQATEALSDDSFANCLTSRSHLTPHFFTGPVSRAKTTKVS